MVTFIERVRRGAKVSTLKLKETEIEILIFIHWSIYERKDMLLLLN
jgi:hypothetical protein